MSPIPIVLALAALTPSNGVSTLFGSEFQVPGAQGQPGGPDSGPPPNPPNGAVPSPAIQAEMVAHLHTYLGDYRKLGAGPPFQPTGTTSSPNKPPEPTGTRIPRTPVRVDIGKGSKELKVYGISLIGADSQYLSVKFKVRIREKNLGVVLYTSEGTARGKFRLAEVKPDRLSLYSPIDLPVADVTVTNLDLPHCSTAAEHDGAKRAIRAGFPSGIWVPLYPTLTIADSHAEEAVYREGKPAPMPNQMVFKARISNYSARTVSFVASTVDGTAKAGTDYSKLARTFSIPSMSREVEIRVGMRYREGIQGTRNFRLRLSPVYNALPSLLEVKGLILDYAGP